MLDPGALGREQNLLNGGAACYQFYATKDGRFISLGALETHFGLISVTPWSGPNGKSANSSLCRKRPWSTKLGT
jgi:hypothetical protein